MLIEIHLKQTLSSQYIGWGLDSPISILNFLLLHYQPGGINLQNKWVNVPKPFKFQHIGNNIPSKVFCNSRTCEINRAFSSCSSMLTSTSKLLLPMVILWGLVLPFVKIDGIESILRAWSWSDPMSASSPIITTKKKKQRLQRNPDNWETSRICRLDTFAKLHNWKYENN